MLEGKVDNFDLFITTDSLGKKEIINEHMKKHPLGICAREWHVIQTPNRGRNVGPLLIDLFDRLIAYECVLHMHSERSEHWGSNRRIWINSLYQCLTGSAELIKDIRSAFNLDNQLGLLIPQANEATRKWAHWGRNFASAKLILQAISQELNLNIDAPLVYPAGMMFWFRPSALVKLSEACRKLQPLPLEPLPLDGSPLHAIERLVAHSCEATGYRWQMICTEKQNDDAEHQEHQVSVMSPLTETYIQASSMLGLKTRELQEAKEEAEKEQSRTIARLRAAEKKRLAMEKEHEQTITSLRTIEKQRLALEKVHQQALRELEEVKQESLENWLIAMEIVNSRIWHSTKFFRNLKDGIKQRQGQKQERNDSSQHNHILADMAGGTIPQPKSTKKNDQASYSDRPYADLDQDWKLNPDRIGSTEASPVIAKTSTGSIPQSELTTKIEGASHSNWLEENMDQDWKLNQDLIRQSDGTAPIRPKDSHKVMIIDWKYPEADKDSGSHRMVEIIRIMLELNIEISFVSQAIDQDPEYNNRLRELNISTYLGIDGALEHLAEAGQSYRYVYMARPNTAETFLPFIQLYCSNAKLIYDTVDLHYVRMRRAVKLLSAYSETEKSSIIKETERYYARELIISKSSDKVIVVSDEEMKHLDDEDASLDIVTIPNIHTITELTPGFEERYGLLFIGGFDHQPNKDAMIYFCNEIMPLISEALANITITIVGSNMPSEISNLESKHVKPLGYVKDLKQFLAEARVFVAPLRYGAGMKGKVGLSMSHGLPVVGTSIAAEGFGVIDGKEMLVTDSPSQFAEYTVSLYRNPEQWNRLSKNSKSFIKKNYSPYAIKDRVAELFNDATYTKKLKINER